MRKLKLSKRLNSIHPIYIFLTFFGIGMIIYFPGLFGDFIWDDEYQIIYTPLTYSVLNLPHIFLRGQLELLYRPMLFTQLTIIHSIFGLNPIPFHFAQIGQHICNTFFVFLIFRKFLSKNISFVLSLFFLAHPMNVEAVTHLSAAGDPIFVFYGLMAFLILAKKRLSVFKFLIGCFLMFLSLLGKETALFAVFVIALFRQFFIPKSLAMTLIFVTVSFSSYFFMRFYIANTFFKQLDHIPIALLPFWERFINLPKIIFFYISTFVAPINLSIAQNWLVREFTFWDFYFPLIIDTLVIGLVLLYLVFLYKSKSKIFKKSLFFFLWFASSFSICLQIFPLDMTVGERWLYFPMIGVLGFIGIVVSQLKIKNKTIRLVLVSSVILLFMFYATRSFIRNIDWLDDYRLFSHDIKITKNSFDLELNYGYQLVKKGRLDEAMVHVKRSIELSPNYTATWAVAGSIYLRKENFEEAIKYYLQSLKKDDTNYAAYYGLIHAYTLLNDNVSAKKWSLEALKHSPDDPFILLFLAIAEYNLGNPQASLEIVRSSVSFSKTKLGEYILYNLSHNQPIPHYKEYIIYN